MKQIKVEFLPGDKVYDDLTREEATIVGVSIKLGKCDGREHGGIVTGYWLDNNHVGGGRHPWEVSALG